MKRMKRITALVLTILIALSGVTDVLADGVKDFDYEQYIRWVEASKNAAAKGDVSEGMLMLGYTSAANVQLMQYSDYKIVKTDESIQSAGTAVVVLETIDNIYGKLNLYQIRYNGGVYFVKQGHISLVSDVPACTCGNENSELKSHADSCNRKKYFHQIADLFTADELASVWDGFKADEKEHMLEYLSWTNQEKLEELKKQLNTTVTTEVEGMKLTIEGGRNVSVSGDAEIPAEAKELFEDKEDHWQFTLDIKADYNPEGVKIEISGLALSDEIEACVYHFLDREEENNEAINRGAEVYNCGSVSYEILPAYVDAENGKVSFTAYTFSTFTVDFHYGENSEYVFNIAGESSILLSELFEAIGYTEHDATEATAVEFSNSELIKIEKEGNDWKITSLKAFHTNERISITFSNGDVYQLLVTDAENSSNPTYGKWISGDLHKDAGGNYYFDSNLTINVAAHYDVIYYFQRDLGWSGNLARNNLVGSNKDVIFRIEYYDFNNNAIPNYTVTYKGKNIYVNYGIIDSADDTGTRVDSGTPIQIVIPANQERDKRLEIWSNYSHLIDHAYARVKLLPGYYDYTFGFNANGDNVSNMPIPNETSYKGDKESDYKHTFTWTSKTPVRTGYTFLGWNTKADGSGTWVRPENDGSYTVNGVVRSEVSTVLYAQWAILKFSVAGSFGDGRGTVTNNSQSSIPYGSSNAEMLFTPSTGYKISGVTVNGASVSGYSDSAYRFVAQPITENKNVVATTAPIEYSITYNNLQGASNPNPSSYTIESADITLLAVSRIGYTFLGWKEGTGIPHGSTGNKVFTADWQENVVNINYQVVGSGSVSRTSETVNVQLGTVLGSTATAADDYKFVGWYSDAECNNKVSDAATYVPQKANATYYAKFELNVANYTVKHMQQNVGGSGYTEVTSDRQTIKGTIGESTAAEAKNYTGFTAQSVVQKTVVASGTVVEILYDRNQHKVTYSYIGNVPGDATALPSAATRRYGETVTVAGAPTATGYTFSGWETEDAEVTSGKFSMPDNAVAFTGSWTAKGDVSYTVKYIEQGTTTEIKTAKVVGNQTFGSEVTETAPAITGFTAVAPTSQKFTLDAYNKAITFYYTRNEYKVTYAYEGKVPAAAPAVPEAATKKFADEVSVASAPSVTGYTFSGWDTEDAEVTSGKFTMPANDVSFIGSWTAKDDVSYTVKYIEQGTTNEIKTAKVVKDQTFDSEVTETAPAITGFTAVAPTSQKFTLDAYNKVITFYYTRNEYKVTYAYEGKVPAAAPAVPEAATKKFADEVSVASAPSVIGYTFSGWDTEDAEVSSGKFSMPDRDVAFIGSWTAKDDVSYTVKYLEQGTDKEIRTAKVVDNQTFDSEVTETAPDITAYKVVEPDSQTITLDAYDKVIIFYYVHSEFTVSYSYVGEVPEGAPDAPEDSKEIATDTVEVADGPTMIGYTFSGWETDDDVTVTEGTFIMPSGDVEFYGSWSANKDVSYSVKYIEQGTDLEIEEAKLVENQTFNSEVTEDAPAITGFTAVEPTSQTIMLDEYDKEITFYYTRNQRKLTYVVEGDDPSADKEVDYFFGDEIEDYEPTQQYFDFSGWYTDSDLTLEWTQPETMPDENITVYGKFVRQEAKLVITKSGMKSGENAIFTVTGNGFSMTVVIPGNGGSVTIAGLNVGETYTITESADWSWRYKSTTAKSVQIVLDGENKAEFVNSPTDTQKWLDDESSAHNVLTAGGEQK